MKTKHKQASLALEMAAVLVPVFFICCALFPNVRTAVITTGQRWLDTLPVTSGETSGKEMDPLPASENEESSSAPKSRDDKPESGNAAPEVTVRLSPSLVDVELDTQRLQTQQQEAGTGLVYVKDEEEWPPFPVELKYEGYPISYLYFLVQEGQQGGQAHIYSEPSWESRILRTAQPREKLSYVETVGTETSLWYHVGWYEDGDGNVIADGSEEGALACFGFVRAETVSRRQFQFEKMAESIAKAQEYEDSGSLTYISNYKNYNGEAPLYNGKEFDGGGNPRNQSAPAYLKPEDRRNFVYLEDGTLVKNLGYEGELVKVQVVENDMIYYVPQRYIPYPKSVTQLNKVIVVDITNQNEGVFERIDGSWTIVSYSLATTGTKSQYADPTPPGFYFLIEKKPQFYYYRDGTTIVDGYAPYALRFNGGAYIHGVSTAYKWENGSAKDPGITEFSTTLGTVPLSHKCVRNYTSHAQFLYDWYTPGETLVIVIN